MFTASHFKLMRKKCLSEIDKLLNIMQIPAPNFEHGDEYKIYEELDRNIEQKLKLQLNSDSISIGYSKLLGIAGLQFNRGETPNQHIEKILANRDKILQSFSTSTTPSASNVETQSHMPLIAGAGFGGGLAALLSYLILDDGPNAIASGAGVAVGFVLPKIFRSSGDNKSPSNEDKLSRAQVETVLKTLEQIDIIFKKIN